MPTGRQAGPYCGLEEWIATTYDRKMHHSEMLRYYGLLSLLPPQALRILDAGCGKGYMSYLLRQRGLTVHAIDIEPASLAVFAARCPVYGITQAQEDFFGYHPTQLFDLVLCQEVLEHLPDPGAALTELARFVNQGGYGVFCVPYRENLEAKMIIDPVTGRRVHKNGHLHSFDPDEFRRLLSTRGFEVLRLQLVTNKRLLNWMGNKKKTLSKLWIAFDRFMNHFFPDRAMYMAFLARKRSPTSA